MKPRISHSQGERRARTQASPLWNGSSFQNVQPLLPGLRSTSEPMPTLKDFLCGGERRVPRAPLPALDPADAWGRRAQSGLRVTWLGHSTTLIEIGGRRILTDPVWGPRASPLRILGPKRFQPVPVRLDALKGVDLIVISHDHYDHLDYPTIRQMRSWKAPIVTSLGVGAHLERFGIQPARIHELEWWQHYRLAGSELEVTAAPSQHFSGRTFKDRNATLWSSFAIRSGRHAVFFSGDTGLTTQYRRIGETLGPFDLVMLEVGAFHPAWGDIHLGPHHALEAHRLLGSGVLLPVHWGTFNLAMHAWDEPAELLYAVGESCSRPLLMPELGEPVEPAQERLLLPWWRSVEEPGSAPRRPSAAAGTANPEAPPRPIPWPFD